MSDTATLFDAIRSGDLSQVKSLLDRNPSLASSKNEAGASAVLLSIYTGRDEIRELLLARGAPLELHEAAAAGNLQLVKQFVGKNPALAKSFSPDGFPIFALACFFGHLDTARYLAEQGADIYAAASNGTGYNALTGAVAAGVRRSSSGCSPPASKPITVTVPVTRHCLRLRRTVISKSSGF